jgi:hypothetical protein
VIFKFAYETRNDLVIAVMSLGPSEETLEISGGLEMKPDEWDCFRRALRSTSDASVRWVKVNRDEREALQ